MKQSIIERLRTDYREALERLFDGLRFAGRNFDELNRGYIFEEHRRNLFPHRNSIYSSSQSRPRIT